MVDETKLNQFVGQMLSDLGGAASIALVRLGDALGLYKILHAKGPMTGRELSAESASNPRGDGVAWGDNPPAYFARPHAFSALATTIIW